MSDRPLITARLFFGVIVLTLGVLWTLDNLGMVDASRILRWWPLVAMLWGSMRLLGWGCGRRPIVGAFWVVVGALSLLHTLGLLSVSVFELWPVFLIALGAALVFRGWRGSSWTGGASETGSRLNAFAFMAGAERKVVAQDFRDGEVSVVMGSATVDLRPARLAEGRAVLDVFAMWGGVEVIVPAGWRVVGEVTPVLGAFVDSLPPPTDPAAPTLVVRGLVVMGGVEVTTEARRSLRYGIVDIEGRRGRRRVRVGHGGVVVGTVVSDPDDRESRHERGGSRSVKVVRVVPGGIEVIRDVRHTAPEQEPATPDPEPPPTGAPPRGPGSGSPGPTVDPE